MSEQMNMQKVVELLKELDDYTEFEKEIDCAITYLEKLQAQPKPTGRTVEEIREYCQKMIKTMPYEYERKWTYEDVLKFIDSAPVEPDRVDDVCEWKLYKSIHDYYMTECGNIYGYTIGLEKVCKFCGRKILRKGE